MLMEKTLNFSEQELATELAALQEELCAFSSQCPDSPEKNNAVWIFRLCQGISTDEWESLSEKHDFRQWLTMPINDNAFPHLKQFQKTLERLAYQTDHDPLTGLANRRAFDRTLDIEMERSRRAKTPLSLAIFDLDNFKSINDTYGHPKGDEVLVKFAEHLKSGTRRYDLAARFGGEEFALIMAGSGVVRAKNLLERLLMEFRQIEFTSPDNKTIFNVTCSAGLTCFKGMGKIDDTQLIELADGALYEAKSAGKNQVKVSRLLFVDNVPNETLVHANEKQFLFGGK
ncbi:GGDEF domain-containing protein [Pseudodesulfovibrio sediminis]|uniref:diguanylate cyclase n=1 Tax=Pseudodesulfovibrio sediminis TaxID=2810563 RepID=A0ABM7P304_9BACT|nr:GGDEF domain-containing protein [Pseudodesulfovibrio sediminis]BCS87237.1 GGDEF domain-containing protein [Pseudodesulfovibrio sediminis]